jgi:hypothetical protein
MNHKYREKKRLKGIESFNITLIAALGILLQNQRGF